MTEQYEQTDILGSSDLQFAEDTAINLIKTFEPVALERCPEHGYIVGYSVCFPDVSLRQSVCKQGFGEHRRNDGDAEKLV